MSYKKRRSTRLKGYNYCLQGVYFVTICIQGNLNIFGRIINGKIVLNKFGVVARNEWLKTAHIRQNVQLDRFVIMPDHMHGILVIDKVGATGSVAHIIPKSKLSALFVSDIDSVTKITIRSNSLGSIIGQYKSMVTRKIRKLGLYDFHWQRNYYDRIIRSKPELYAIRKYIEENPRNHPYMCTTDPVVK